MRRGAGVKLWFIPFPLQTGSTSSLWVHISLQQQFLLQRTQVIRCLLVSNEHIADIALAQACELHSYQSFTSVPFQPRNIPIYTVTSVSRGCCYGKIMHYQCHCNPKALDADSINFLLTWRVKPVWDNIPILWYSIHAGKGSTSNLVCVQSPPCLTVMEIEPGHFNVFAWRSQMAPFSSAQHFLKKQSTNTWRRRTPQPFTLLTNALYYIWCCVVNQGEASRTQPQNECLPCR